jgi:tetratricopeptide (TPR) repeat protein
LDDEQLTDSTYLWLLASWLGGSLPGTLLMRARSAQVRWNDDGKWIELTPSEAGIDQQLLEILSTDIRRENALSCFHRNDPAEQGWTVAGTPELCETLIQSKKPSLCIQALKWVCFAFPRVEEQEPQYTSLVRLLLPLLNNVLQELDCSRLSDSVKHEIADVLLAASKIADAREAVLPKIAIYLNNNSPLCLQAGLALEQSISLRLCGDYDGSERTIHDFCCNCASPADECLPRFFTTCSSSITGQPKAIYGLLHRSHLENLVQREHCALAERQIDDWPLEPDSQMGWTTVRPRVLTSSKIYRSRGNFRAARDTLELCWKTSQYDHETIYPRVLCQLLDVYSDLGLSDMSRSMIAPVLEKYEGRVPRRVLVSSIDIDVQRGHYRDARETIEKLRKVFDARRPLNISDELLHIRSLIASARISHLGAEFDDALESWKVVLDHAQRYQSFAGEGFTYAVIHLSLSLVYLKLNEHDAAVISFKHGARILKEQKRDFWIPTLPTWMQYVASEIHSNYGWSCYDIDDDSYVSDVL